MTATEEPALTAEATELIAAVLDHPAEDTPRRMLQDELDSLGLWTWDHVFGLVRKYSDHQSDGLRLLAANWLEQDATPATIRRLEPTPEEGYRRYSVALVAPTGPEKWVEAPNPEYRGGWARTEFIRVQCLLAGNGGTVDNYRDWGRLGNWYLNSHAAAFVGIPGAYQEAELFGTWGNTVASGDCRVVFHRGWVDSVECSAAFWLAHAERDVLGTGADLVKNHLLRRVRLTSEIQAVVGHDDRILLIGADNRPGPSVARTCQRAIVHPAHRAGQLLNVANVRAAEWPGIEFLGWLVGDPYVSPYTGPGAIPGLGDTAEISLTGTLNLTDAGRVFFDGMQTLSSQLATAAVTLAPAFAKAGAAIAEAGREIGRALVDRLPRRDLELLARVAEHEGAETLLPELERLLAQSCSVDSGAWVAELPSGGTLHRSWENSPPARCCMPYDGEGGGLCRKCARIDRIRSLVG